jgi:hypothetical protein
MSEQNFVKPDAIESFADQDLSAKYWHIKGWGIDADPKNDPTYPIRQRNDAARRAHTWDRPGQQPGSENILRSNERPVVTSVFGTAAPLSGISGAIRRCAFHYSESRYRHWLLLLLADRVNVIEGLTDDVRRGRIPNCLDERGFSAELKYNRKEVVTRAAVGAVVLTSIVLLLKRKKAGLHK